jgi:acyl-CoA dehydrogenase
MDYSFDHSVADKVRSTSSKWNPSYWREIYRKKEFPHDYWGSLAKEGLLGMVVPPEYGGMGRSLLDLVLATGETAERYAGIASYLFLSGCLVSTIFAKSRPQQKEQILPQLARGAIKISIALSEENSGFEASALETKAEQVSGHFVLSGSKRFVNNVDLVDYLVVFARTRNVVDSGGKKASGISMFLVSADDAKIQRRKLDKVGWDFVNNFDIEFRDLKVPEENLVGELHQGWYNAVESFNLDRVATAASLVGTGKLALNTAAERAKNRRVFGKIVGTNQGIQFPLADAAAELIIAETFVLKAASMSGAGRMFVDAANLALYQALTAATLATDRAMQTFGGHGYYSDYNVERYWRDVRAHRVHPLSEELLLASIAEKSLGLPKSY